MLKPGGFILQNPRFFFDIVEHIELGSAIEFAKARFFQMANSTAAPTDGEIWHNWRAALREATNDVPAYAGITWEGDEFPRSIDLIDKERLRANPDAFLSKRFDASQLWHRPTSGTSGRPITLRYSAEYCSEFHYFGVAASLLHAGLFEASLHKSPIYCLSLIDQPDLDDRIWVDPSDLTGATLRVVFDPTKASSVNDIKGLLSQHRPTILSLKPSILEILVDSAHREPGWTKGLVAIVSGGSQLSSNLRLRAQSCFETSVIDAYGMTEVGAIASSCRLGELHIHESQVIVEILRDGLISSEGTGELVVTGIRNRAMPILRYRTGDGGHITRDPCSCGLPSRRLISLEGRLAPLFFLPNGSRFSPTILNRLQHRLPIREFQAIQAEDGSISIIVEWEDDELSDSWVERTKSEIRKLVGDQIAFSVLPGNFNGGDKFQRYVSLRTSQS
jgi:phenylacetate-CoA ligase